MSKDTSSSIYLRFAAVSFGAIVLIASGLAFLGINLVRGSAEQSAARSSTDIAGGPLTAALESASPGEPLSPSVRARLDAVASPLISPGLPGIRIWGPDGGVVYGAGDQASLVEATPPRTNERSKRASNSAGDGLFVTYVRSGPYTVEIDQTAGVLTTSIFHAQRTFVMLMAALAALVYIVVQVAFWLCVRRLAEGHRRLLYLYNTGDEIRSSLDLHEVVTHLSRDATRLARGDYGIIALFQEASGDLVLHATCDAATGTITHHQRPVEEWFLRRCAATNTTVVSTQQASAYQHLFGAELEERMTGKVALLCVPISVRDRVVGVVAVLRTGSRPSGYSMTEIAQVQQLSGQAVTAVEQAQLFAKVRSYADEIELSYDATLKALMAALDAKDELTEGHCERVAKLTIHLARDMGVPDDQLINIERGSLLHDVGKIGVPDAVLKKPKALNDLEWEAMRKHPLLAGLMVSKIGFLEGALPILLYHHERFDGTGYPFGLTADKIPLEARIFSIIDAYDAMTSDRPYRAAMTHEEAMEEIERNLGTQFDPDVVAAFERLMESRPELQHRSPHRMDPEYDDHDVLPPNISGPSEHAA